VRSGSAAASAVSRQDMQCLLRAWLSAVELDGRDPIAYMQDDRFSHKDLYRRACRLHERKLRAAVEQALVAARGEGAVSAAAFGLFESCIAAIPYAPATAFVASEQAKLDARREEGETPRVAVLADGIGSTHGVTRVIEEIRDRGVEGFEIEVVGTDPAVDRRLSAVSEFEVPYYPGLRIGVPSLAAAVQTLTEGTFDLIHVCSPGPAGIAGALVSRGIGVPLVGSYHTELTAYAGLRSGDRFISQAMETVVGGFYGACDLVLSPSPASDAALAQIGVASQRVKRWDRGVDTNRFDPGLRRPSGPPGAINVLYVGRISHEKGADLLADAFLRAQARDPRLRLVLVGGGPEEARLRARVGDRAEFLGWLDGLALARAYASADIFLFASRTDTFGQVILEAQASGLAVVAAAAGGPLSLIEDRVSGMLCDPDAAALADAVLELAAQPRLRERLARGGLESVTARTWERALERLAGAYRLALGDRERSHLARAA
jgi:glycosyltransferase involved in cell wall biosynthesis